MKEYLKMLWVVLWIPPFVLLGSLMAVIVYLATGDEDKMRDLLDYLFQF